MSDELNNEPFVAGYMHPLNDCPARGLYNYIKGPKDTPCPECGEVGDDDAVFSIRLRYEGVVKDLV